MVGIRVLAPLLIIFLLWPAWPVEPAHATGSGTHCFLEARQAILRSAFREVLAEDDSGRKYAALTAAMNRKNLSEGRYPVIPLVERYQGWGEGGARAHRSGQAEDYYRSLRDPRLIPLTIRNGLVYGPDGRLFDTSGATMRGKSGKVGVTGRAIFVMNELGNFYCHLHPEVDKVHHSTLLEGLPVAAAGEVRVAQGVVKEITDRTGHYLAPRFATENAIAQLANGGVDTKSGAMRVTLDAPARVEAGEHRRLTEAGVPPELVPLRLDAPAETSTILAGIRSSVEAEATAAMGRLEVWIQTVLNSQPERIAELGDVTPRIARYVQEKRASPVVVARMAHLGDLIHARSRAILQDGSASLEAREWAVDYLASELVFGRRENLDTLVALARSQTYAHLSERAIQGLTEHFGNTLADGRADAAGQEGLERSLAVVLEGDRGAGYSEFSGWSTLRIAMESSLNNGLSRERQSQAARFVLQSEALRRLAQGHGEQAAQADRLIQKAQKIAGAAP